MPGPARCGVVTYPGWGGGSTATHVVEQAFTNSGSTSVPTLREIQA
jgi:hypothetical protein